MTQVYLSDIRRYDGRIEKLKEGLSSSVLSHCLRYPEKREVQASLLGWNILSLMLEKEGTDLSALSLTYNESGKPFLGNHFFSISHSGNIVAVCLSTSEVGIDIELIRKDRNYDLLAKRYFSPEEKNEYDRSEDKAGCFVRLWTRKEAFHKHVGDGMRLDRIRRTLPYSDIYTVFLKDGDGNGYYLSVDCIDNEKVLLSVI